MSSYRPLPLLVGLFLFGTLAPAARCEAPKGQPVRLRVALPANATLVINDAPTTSTGSDRLFESPSVVPGKSYYYILKATWETNGDSMVCEKKISVEPGQTTSVDLTKPDKVVKNTKPVDPEKTDSTPVKPKIDPAKDPKDTAKPVISKDNPVVIVETSAGTMKIELFPKKAPDMVKHFLSYVNREDRHYDGTIFHNVTDSMIQGGLFKPDLEPKPSGLPEECEGFNGVSNERGTIAMVQRREIAENMNITTPFLINVKDNKQLDKDNKVGSAVFGKVFEGFDVLDKIAGTRTARKGSFDNVPIKPVVIKSIRVAK